MTSDILVDAGIAALKIFGVITVAVVALTLLYKSGS